MAATKPAEREKKKSDAIYSIRFYGTFFTHAPGVYEQFEMTCKFDQEMIDRDPKSVFKNDLAPEMMPQKYPNFRRLRKYFDDPAVQLSGSSYKSNINIMSREALLAYAENWNDSEGMEIELAMHPTLAELRTAVQEYENDPEGFLIRQNELMAKFGDKIKNKRKSLALQNIEIGVDKGLDVSLPASGSTKVGKAAKEAFNAEQEAIKEGSRAGLKKKSAKDLEDEDF